MSDHTDGNGALPPHGSHVPRPPARASARARLLLLLSAAFVAGMSGCGNGGTRPPAQSSGGNFAQVAAGNVSPAAGGRDDAAPAGSGPASAGLSSGIAGSPQSGNRAGAGGAAAIGGADAADSGGVGAGKGAAAAGVGGGSATGGSGGVAAGSQADQAGTSGTVAQSQGDWGPGDYPPKLNEEEYLELSVQGEPRQYKVHVPASYTSDTPTPLVFCLHGLAQTAVMFCLAGAGMAATSDEAGFILVMPNGIDSSWNGGVCCGGSAASKRDDVAVIRAILREVEGHLNVDPERVYATGLSTGGYLSYRLACEAADIFAAVAPSAGAVGTNELAGKYIEPGSITNVALNMMSDLTKCEPSRAISVLDLHGTQDPLIPFALQDPSLAVFAMRNGCAGQSMPALSPASAGDTTCTSYSGCPDGLEVTGCSVKGGGHCWFGSADCGTGAGDLGKAFVGEGSDTLVNNAAVWEFFKRHTRSR